MSHPLGVIRWLPYTPSDPALAVCEGQAISRTTYASLFALIGTTFGEGDGLTTFNLPDLTDACTIGAATPGATVGSNTITLSVANLPAHDHTLRCVESAVGTGTAAGNALSAETIGTGYAAAAPDADMRASVSSTGSGAAFSVQQLSQPLVPVMRLMESPRTRSGSLSPGSICIRC